MALRKYQSAWNQLKALPEGEPLRISCPRIWQARILKAIIKEKYIDTIFHLQQAELNRRAILSHTRDSGEIRFYLSYSISTADL